VEVAVGVRNDWNDTSHCEDDDGTGKHTGRADRRVTAAQRPAAIQLLATNPLNTQQPYTAGFEK